MKEVLTINVFRALQFKNELDLFFKIDVIHKAVKTFIFDHPQNPLEACLVHIEDLPSELEEAKYCVRYSEVAKVGDG